MAGEPYSIWEKIPPLFRSKFFLVPFGFFLYLMFLDSNDIPSQVKLKMQENKLKNQAKYYTKEIVNVKKERAQLFSGTDEMEKFARENYYMKRDSEDLYIIVEEEKKRKGNFLSDLFK